MADALKLTEVANDKGFKRRVAYFLNKKAHSVLADNSPDATDLGFAKLVAKDPNSHSVAYAAMLVTVDSVAAALEGVDYQHTQAPDDDIETVVNAKYSNFAKGVV